MQNPPIFANQKKYTRPKKAQPPIVHIAGDAMVVGSVARQRCSWCGYMLINRDLNEDPVEEKSRAAATLEQINNVFFNCGDPVLVRREPGEDKETLLVLTHLIDQDLPEHACAMIEFKALARMQEASERKLIVPGGSAGSLIIPASADMN